MLYQYNPWFCRGLTLAATKNHQTISQRPVVSWKQSATSNTNKHALSGKMAPPKSLTLYSYFYSSASWRIRSVLAHKDIPFNYEPVHLLNGVQHSEEYLKVNPMHQVPSMTVEFEGDDTKHVLTQSLAIISFLEDLYPEKSVYPKDPIKKAQALAIADTISGGIQPLQNLETLTRYGEPIGVTVSPEDRQKIASFWIDIKLKNLETLVAKSAGKYCVGDEFTVADACLVPQMFNARRFKIDTSKFPLLHSIDERLNELDIIKAGHPYNCPDTPKELRQAQQ